MSEGDDGLRKKRCGYCHRVHNRFYLEVYEGVSWVECRFFYCPRVGN